MMCRYDSTEFLCYDDGRNYFCNPDQMSTARRIADLSIVVDKFHFKGHTDKWCLEICLSN